jgi:hypothetical protein
MRLNMEMQNSVIVLSIKVADTIIANETAINFGTKVSVCS